MFTAKFYSDLGSRIRIVPAETLTILEMPDGYEVTLHGKTIGDDVRFDVKDPWPEARTSDEQSKQWPQRFQRLIIENTAGKTTEFIDLHPRHTRHAELKAA